MNSFCLKASYPPVLCFMSQLFPQSQQAGEAWSRSESDTEKHPPSLVFVLAAPASLSKAGEAPCSCPIPSVLLSFGLLSASVFFLVMFITPGVRDGRWMGAGLEIGVGEGGLCFDTPGEGGRVFCLLK